MSDYFKNTFEYLVSILQFFEYLIYFLIGLTIFIVSILIIEITKLLAVVPKKITDLEFYKRIVIKIFKFFLYLILITLTGKITFYWVSSY